MQIYDAVGLAISSAGHRRGAQMGVLRVDHPDIEEFIRAKQKPGALEGFNISIAITDAFMEAVNNDTSFTLMFDKRPHGEINARDLWEQIMRATWDWAEPGVIFIDRINNQNNLKYCETIAATNPCGEQPLPPHGACLLGSFNLVNYLVFSPVNEGRAKGFDFDQMALDIPHVVRAMDNVIDRTRYAIYLGLQRCRQRR